MSYTNIDNNILNYNISDGAFKLYFLLQSMCYGDKTQCYPSQKYLSEKLNKSIKTIQRYLQELLSVGLIKKKRRGSISNIYTLMLKISSQKAQSAVNMVNELKNKFSKSQASAGTKNNYYENKYKKSSWKLDSRNYNFESLENMLLGYDSYNVNKLYK